MRNLQELQPDPGPATDFGRLAGPSATDVPSVETLQSALHWLTECGPHPEHRELHAWLVAQDELALAGRAA